MADNEELEEHQDVERKVQRCYSSGIREQRMTSKGRDKIVESRLPTPPPDPWASPWGLQGGKEEEMRRTRSLEEDEDILAYLTDIGTPPFESQTSECPSRNTGTSTMAVASLCTDEAFEHLDRLYALTEQILELRDRSAKFFKRVRNLERLKVLRNADRRLENAFASDKVPTADFSDEDTGFAETLLDAILSNSRDPLFQRRNIRSPSSRRTRSKSLALSQQSLQRSPNLANRFDEKQMSGDDIAKGAPKVSKWTRVKAAFKWERACTTDIAETMDATNMPSTASSTPTTKYLRIPDFEIGNSSGTIASSCNSETCDSAAIFGRISSASSSNEGSYNCSRKDVSCNSELQSSGTKEDKTECNSRRSCSLDEDTMVLDTDQSNDTESINEVGQGKPQIRITLDKNRTTSTLNVTEKKDTEPITKRPTPTLTITIPSHEEEVRCMSSPESISPLPSSAHTSGGNSPLYRKIRQELSASKNFKRQQSAGEESVSLSSKMQRQDSKWNKVRRAFLTNSTFSVPPSPIRVISRQMLLQDGLEAPVAYSCVGSVEDLEKMTRLNAQTETQRDYRALREKLGAEFHRKLIEWERLKNLSPRGASKTSRDVPSGLSSPRETLLPEEKLAPEFRKKLQDWKRARKERRGSAPFEQQRVSRRRLTDWQLWRSPSKTEYRNMGSRGSCESGESTASDGKTNLCEDFVRKMEARKRNDRSDRDAKQTMWSNSNRLGITSVIDESEFLALEGVLALFENGVEKERQESDVRRLDECFDGDTRSYIDGPQGVNCCNEVFVRTPVGSYRFEGISREFTRKLYDWERYRRISPRSSTFRLLGPAYEPFVGKTDIETAPNTPDITKIGDDERELFRNGTLRRWKSDGNVAKEIVHDESFIRHSTSLQSLSYHSSRLKNDDCMDTLPASMDPQRAEDSIMDDSEPEAVIVDIEDVIEETASPLKRVQPHQTPVYSVAASETTSIAVPLGTVTSSHEPSPVFLVEIEENSDHKRWDSRRRRRKTNFTHQDSSNSERVESTEIWSNEDCSSSQNSVDSKRFETRDDHSTKDVFELSNSDADQDSVTSSISVHSSKVEQKYEILNELIETTKQEYIESKREDIPAVSCDGESVTDANAVEHEPEVGINENETIRGRNVGKRSTFATGIKLSTDLSSENKHEGEREDQGPVADGSDEDEKDVAVAETKCDNEYEEIVLDTNDPYYCSIRDTRSMTDCREGTAKALPNLLSNCRLGKSNYAASKVDPFVVNQEGYDFKKHEKNYGVMRDELHGRHEYHNLSVKRSDLQNCEASKSCMGYLDREKESNYAEEAAMSTESTGERCHEFENASASLTLRSADLGSFECHHESSIQTTPLTVTTHREERCFERIIINEETLNKIVVPTASTGQTENTKDSKQSIERLTTKDSSEERDYQSNAIDNVAINRETTSAKKQYSSTRNVLIKTKRMIFSPFRRGDDHSSGKKENNVSEGDESNDHVFPMKSKSKSRSVSPKIHRQEPLLKMSFSLPWPLRSSSRDREIKEAKIEESSKEEGMVIEKLDRKRRAATEERKRSFSDKSTVLLETQKVSTSGDRRSSVGLLAEESSRFKYFLGQRERGSSMSEQGTSDTIVQENRTVVAVSTSSLQNQEKKPETPSPSPLTLDPHSSDLIHKLRILSNAVARRDGRTNTISEESALEPHAMRIRRAKEDFLSRRGGPLCHSVLEPRSFKSHNFSKMSAHFREHVAEDQRQTTRHERIIPVTLDSSHTVQSEGSSSNGCKAKETETRDEGTKLFAEHVESNELSSSAASKPDRVKSASVGMINVDPDTFERLTESSRGCESLPRTTSKQEQPGPLAKIVSKFKFTRLIRSKDIEERDMSTISRLCRQSLLIDVRNDFERRWEAGRRDREGVSKFRNVDKGKNKHDFDDLIR